MASTWRLLLFASVFVATSAMDCSNTRMPPPAVPPQVISAVLVTPTDASLAVGEEVRLVVLVTGTSTTVQAIDQTVRWSASNGNATVSAAVS